MAARTRPADRLTAAYKARAAAIRAEVARRVEALYGDVDPDAIDVSVKRFIDDAEPVIAAGQASIATLVAAFIRSRSAIAGELVEPVDDEEQIAGTTRDGSSLATGMAAFGPMILSQIAAGKPVDEAMQFGQYLATRFADSELSGAADREAQHQARSSDRITGWEGIVSPDSCDPCRGNAGTHPLDEEIYRHPDCGCEWVPVFGG